MAAFVEWLFPYFQGKYIRETPLETSVRTAYLRVFNIEVAEASEKLKCLNFIVISKRDNTACQQRVHLNFH